MSEPSDWEPLTETQRASNPGEAANTRPRPAVDAAAQRAADAAAERALQELQARIRKATPSCSLVAEVQRRAARHERRQRAAQAPALGSCKPVRSTVQVSDLPLDLQYDPGADGRDSREEQPWFLALPEAERARLHEQWAAERTRFLGAGRRRLAGIGRAMGGGALVMLLLGLAQALLLGGFCMVPALVAAGAIAAGVAQACRAGRYGFALAGGVAYTALMIPTILGNPYALPSILMAVYGMGLIGMGEEMRRTGGFDAP
jgi:hypothetical protein